MINRQYGKVQKLMRKKRRNKGRNAEFYVIGILQVAEQPAEFHIGEELIAVQLDNFRSLLYDDLPELLQPLDSQQVSRDWDHSIDTTSPIMKCQRLNILSLAQRAYLNRQLKDAMKVGLIRPSQSQFGAPILFVRRTDGSLRLCTDYTAVLTRLRVRTLTHLRVWTTLSMNLRARFFTEVSAI
jgi:hypothetical protein